MYSLPLNIFNSSEALQNWHRISTGHFMGFYEVTNPINGSYFDYNPVCTKDQHGNFSFSDDIMGPSLYLPNPNCGIDAAGNVLLISSSYIARESIHDSLVCWKVTRSLEVKTICPPKPGKCIYSTICVVDFQTHKLTFLIEVRLYYGIQTLYCWNISNEQEILAEFSFIVPVAKISCCTAYYDPKYGLTIFLIQENNSLRQWFLRGDLLLEKSNFLYYSAVACINYTNAQGKVEIVVSTIEANESKLLYLDAEDGRIVNAVLLELKQAIYRFLNFPPPELVKKGFALLGITKAGELYYLTKHSVSFRDFPDELHAQVAGYLTRPEQLAWGATNKKFHALMQSEAIARVAAMPAIYDYSKVEKIIDLTNKPEFKFFLHKGLIKLDNNTFASYYQENLIDDDILINIFNINGRLGSIRESCRSHAKLFYLGANKLAVSGFHFKEGARSNYTHVWDIKRGIRLYCLAIGCTGLLDLNEEIFISNDDFEDKLCVWHKHDGQLLYEIKVEDKKKLFKLDSEKFIIICDDNHELELWQWDNKSCTIYLLGKFKIDFKPYVRAYISLSALDLIPIGKNKFVLFYALYLQIWEINNDQLIFLSSRLQYTPSSPYRNYCCKLFNLGNQVFASCSSGPAIGIWDGNTRELIFKRTEELQDASGKDVTFCALNNGCLIYRAGQQLKMLSFAEKSSIPKL